MNGFVRGVLAKIVVVRSATDRLFAQRTTTVLLIGLVFMSGCAGPAEESNKDPHSHPKTTQSDRGQPGTPAEQPPVKTSTGQQAAEATPSNSIVGAEHSATSPGANNPPPTAASGDKSAEEKFREPLFVGWPKPQVALFLTGQQHGYIEPCGCTGLANQKGGLARRATLKKELADKGWEVVALDVGNQVRRFGPQPIIKFGKTIEGLDKMGYRAVALGPDDLRQEAVDLIGATLNSVMGENAYTDANVVFEIDDTFTSPYRVVTAGGKKIGITAVLGDSEQPGITNTDLVLTPAAEALAAVWPKLKDERCDLYVLLAHTSLDESRAIARQFPDFDLIVTAGGAGEPTLEPEKIEGTNSQMVQVGTKGMYVGVVGVFDDPQQPLRYQRVPLDDRFADAPEMLELLASYQKELEHAGLLALTGAPRPHPTGRLFVGSEACQECHSREYKIWRNGVDGKGGPHWHATESLVHPGERSNIPRHYDPECLSCHVTGWNPQKYYPYDSGYIGLDESQHLHGNGCENCHGPGSRHVEAEGEGLLDDVDLEKLRDGMRLSLDEARKSKCMECHDLDNSPDFHVEGAFDKYWAKIAH